MTAVDDQVQLIAEVAGALATAGLKAWLFGGWGMDAHIGRVTRKHGDVEFWVERPEREGVLEVLTSRGFELLPTQPPDESFEFERNALRFSTAFFDRTHDGFSKPSGRWSDWRFPRGAFADAWGKVGQAPVRVMSLEGLLAMKTQYPTLRNGKPWRPKDVSDMAAIQALLASSEGQPISEKAP